MDGSNIIKVLQLISVLTNFKYKWQINDRSFALLIKTQLVGFWCTISSIISEIYFNFDYNLQNILNQSV